MNMDAHTLLIAGLNFTQAETFSTALYRFVADRSLIIYGIDKFAWCQDQWCKDILDWLLRPDVLTVITVWWITFTIVLIITLTLGFGPAGIGLGTAAAAFQSYMYGEFTPAGGIFATLTSMAMLGTFAGPAVLFASILATGVAALVWGLGVRI